MDMARSRYLFFVEITAALLLLIYPTLMLTVKGGMNGVFLFMLLLSIAVWIVRPAGMGAVKWQPEWRIYFVAMLAMSTAILISQSYHQSYDGHPHDAASRYWLAIPLFLLLQRLRLNVFSVLQFAFPVAAMAGFLLANHLGSRLGIDTLDAIHFGDFELILGVLSLFSLDWFGRDRFPLRILKILGFIAGLAASLASGSKGGWLAIPVFIVIFLYFKMGKISLRMVATSLTSIMLFIAIAYTSNTTVHQRVRELANEVTALNQGNYETSTGIRWQLYNAAADIFMHHPIFGVGPEGFALEMKPMMESGKITAQSAYYGSGEVHNDILSKAAGMGVFGLIAMLGVYVVPFRLFRQATKSTSLQIKQTGVLGIIFVSGFFVFGLTVEFLNLTMAAAFYSFTVAVLLAACYNVNCREQPIQ